MATYSNSGIDEKEARDEVYNERKSSEDGLVIGSWRVAAAGFVGFQAIFNIPPGEATAHGGDVM